MKKNNSFDFHHIPKLSIGFKVHRENLKLSVSGLITVKQLAILELCQVKEYSGTSL